MKDHIFGDREKAIEDTYFRKEDTKLLEKLREKAPLDQIALALRNKLHVDNPGLLMRARATGVAPDAAPALFLAPLVQVAWADGSISRAERKAVLRLARSRGVDPESAAGGQLIDWMDERPPDSIFETALEVIKYGFSVLTPGEREDRIRGIVDACSEVAAASGTIMGWALALVDPDAAAARETAILQMIAGRLRAPPGSN